MMRKPILVLLSCLCMAQAWAQNDAAPYRELLDTYCSDCHNSEDWAGSLAFDLMNLDNVGHDPEVWETAIRKLRGRLMPPPGNDQPSQRDIDRFVSYLESNLDAALADSQGPLAGHVPVQRLNRTEYAIAVKELLGIDIDPADYLPADIEVDGFDNIAAALSVSPSFLEQYINVARAVARLAVGQQAPKVANAYFQVQTGEQDAYMPGLPLGTRGGMKVTYNFPADGDYKLNILDLDVGLYPRSIETRQTLVVLVDDEEVFREYIGGPEDFALVNKGGAPGRGKIMERFQDIPMAVKAGVHDVTVTFIERARVETDEMIGGFTPYGGFAFTGSLRVPRLLDGIQIVGPFDPGGVSMTASREKIFVCQPASRAQEKPCAAQIAEHLAHKAYRRPVTQDDLDLLMPFFEAGRANGGFDAGVEQIVAAILASPDFLYRGISPMRDIGDARVFALNDLELASRLSFFLWGQGPDDTLQALAENGELKKPGVLEAQAKRMLADPRARHLVNSFAMKWLNLDELEVIDPDPALFPEFNDQMYGYFYEELKRFLASVLLEDKPAIDLLQADWTYLNEPLARHYGIEDVHGVQFRKVHLDDKRRWGILGKGATLLRTSYGDRTSPVLRGAWVLEKLMGTPPTPPPPNVNTDLSVKAGQKFTTIRARLEQHRSKPGCSQCHGVIDPIGLALENFDVTGQWRDVDVQADAPIDASTVLPNGKAITGVIELREELASRPEQFALALTERLMMYALNRELEYFDMPQVRAIVHNAEASDYRLSALVTGIVNSDAFHRQALPHEQDGGQVAAVAGE